MAIDGCEPSHVQGLQVQRDDTTISVVVRAVTWHKTLYIYVYSTCTYLRYVPINAHTPLADPEGLGSPRTVAWFNKGLNNH